MAHVSPSVVQKILGRVVAYHTAFTLLPGVSVPGAVFLSQAFYWSRNPEVEKRGGWFYKNQSGKEDSWESETGLSPKQQANARKSLVEIGVLEEVRKGVPARTWYRINCERLLELLAAIMEDSGSGNNGTSQILPKGESSSSLMDSLVHPDSQPLRHLKGEAITETTAENTTKNGASPKFEKYEAHGDQLTLAEMAEMLGKKKAELVASRYGSDKIGARAVEEMRRTLRT